MSLITAGAAALLLASAVVGLVITPASAVGHSASIVDVSPYTYAFSPASITIHVGDRITWTNMSVAPHNVTFASFGSPYSMDTGATYTHSFGSAGTFRYTCTIHGFSAKVIVVGAAATPKPTPKPTPRPTPKPTPRPTARPTSAPTPATTPSTVAPAPSTASTTAVAAAVPSATEVPSASAAVAYGASGTPLSSSSSDSTGLLLPVVVGLVGVGIVALGAVLLRRQ